MIFGSMTLQTVDKTLSFILKLCIFCININYGQPQVIAHLDSITCRGNPHYTYPPNCSVKFDSNHQSTGFFDIQVKRELKSPKFGVALNLLIGKTNRTLVNVKNKNACAVYDGRATGMIKAFKDSLERFGDFPTKCPIEKDFHFSFNNVFIDMSAMPPYLFDADFFAFIKFSEGTELAYSVEILGRIRKPKGKTNKLFGI